MLQKGINYKFLERKTPRMSCCIGLQCVLSGNQVLYLATIQLFLKGEPLIGNDKLK